MIYTIENLNIKTFALLLFLNNLNSTILHENNIEYIKEIISSENINKRDALGQTVFHAAVWTNNYEALTLLLKHGADINLQDNFGRTPLHCAIYNDNLDLARTLILMKAKINIADNTNRTPKELIYDRQEYMPLLNTLKNQLNSKL